MAPGSHPGCLSSWAQGGKGAQSAPQPTRGSPFCSRMRGTRLTGLLLALAGLLQLGLSLKIAAFNIRTFGETKMSNATLSSYIVRVSPALSPGPSGWGSWRWAV